MALSGEEKLCTSIGGHVEEGLPIQHTGPSSPIDLAFSAAVRVFTVFVQLLEEKHMPSLRPLPRLA